MARRKAKVRPEASLPGNVSEENDREWIALNNSAGGLPVSLQSTNAATAPKAQGDAAGAWSNLNIAVDLPGLAKPKLPPLSPNFCMKRQANNIACCEKTLQENDPETCPRRGSVGSYAILHSEPSLAGDDAVFSTEIGQSEIDNSNAAELHERDGGRTVTNSSRDMQAQRRSLLDYFAQITSSSEVDVAVDLEYMKTLLIGGASVNESDNFGQTVLHEVSRVWGIDVAQFLVDEGADVNVVDKFGRTPLHVAAAADYHEMVRFLLEQGANVEAQTTGENQTPLHYAARNEAVQCVKTLLDYGAKIDARDYKQRTPLQTAAEHSSAEVASFLLEKGAPAGVKDDSGLSALALLISKMPNVAVRALDQFHIVDRSHRKQHMYLNFLENCGVSSVKHSRAPSSLQVAVESNCFELFMHPIVQSLIDVKWKRLGRAGAWFEIFPNLLLTILYTVIGVIYPTDVTNYYKSLATIFWRLILDSVVIALTVNEIRKEVKEYYRSKREHTKWKQWRTSELQRDLEFCHPRWVQEKAFVDREIHLTRDRKKTYFQDVWNYLDWLTYLMLTVVFIMHYINIALNNNRYNDVVIKIMASTLILIWLRMLKFARPFPTQGPFVVMLDHIMVDTSKWSFLVVMIYIPFAAAFWMVFGGRTKNPVSGYDTIENLLFTLIRFPLVDDYNFDCLDMAFNMTDCTKVLNMTNCREIKALNITDCLEKKAPIMSRVLCGVMLVITAIILMNMYIALLSNTFQRVYDNAKATAAMQRARWIQDIEASSSRSKVAKYRDFIRTDCSPAQRDYLVILTDEEAQDRKQEEKISEMHCIVSKRLAVNARGRTSAKSDFDAVMEDVSHVKVSQTEIRQSLAFLDKRLVHISLTNTLMLAELRDLKSWHEEINLRQSLPSTNQADETQVLADECPVELFSKRVKPKAVAKKVEKKRKKMEERSVGQNHEQSSAKKANLGRLRPHQVEETQADECPDELFSERVEPKPVTVRTWLQKAVAKKVEKRRKKYEERSVGQNYEQSSAKKADISRLRRIYGSPKVKAKSLVFLKEDGCESDDSTGAYSA